MTGTCKSTMKLIRKRYIEIRDDLKIDFDIEKYLDEVQEGINKSEDADFAASRGEYLSGLLIAAYLGYEFIDAAEIIKFKIIN